MNMHSTPAHPTPPGYKVDISRGQNIGRVSSEWFRRPADERFLSLDDLLARVRARAHAATTQIVESRKIRVEAHTETPRSPRADPAGAPEPVAPTNWSFGQLCSLVGAPAHYLRELPSQIAGNNLQYGLVEHRADRLNCSRTHDGRTELRRRDRPRLRPYLGP